MKIRIIETNKTEELTIIDPQSGVNWISDLMGNHGALPEYDEDNDMFVMSQEDYDWWHDLTTELEKAEYRCHELREELVGQAREDFEEDIRNIATDLEDLPKALNAVCKEAKKD